MDLAPNVKTYLLTKYQDTKFPGAYAGVGKFYRAIKKDNKFKITRNQVKNFLQSQSHYTLLKNAKYKYQRNRVITPYAGYQIDLDTAHILNYAKENGGFKYIIGAIDCFTKVAHTIAVKSLKAADFIPALEKLLAKFEKIENCRTDRGSEFKSSSAKELFNKLRINHFMVNNDETKSNIIERFFRTLKSMLYRYMLHRNTHKWIDQLENITMNYNSSFHTSIQQSPSSVKPEDEYKIWKLLYETNRPDRIFTKFRFDINDTVRISVTKHAFSREFDESWSREHFFITDRFTKDIKPVYTLKDLENEGLMGVYTEEELQKVYIPNDEIYIIEKIERRSKGKVLVRWLGWPPKFSTWIRSNELLNLQKLSKVS